MVVETMINTEKRGIRQKGLRKERTKFKGSRDKKPQLNSNEKNKKTGQRRPGNTFQKKRE